MLLAAASGRLHVPSRSPLRRSLHQVSAPIIHAWLTQPKLSCSEGRLASGAESQSVESGQSVTKIQSGGCNPCP